MFEKKRKRDDDRQDDSGRIELRRGDVRPQQEYLEKLLQGSKRLLAQALKLAKGFERQKLGRRQKTAKGAANLDESKRLVAEVKALKSLGIESTAENYLYKSLLKNKPVASAPAFPSDLQARGGEKSKPSDPAQANVQARLFNSQPVKKAMNDIVSRVCSALGLEEVQHVRKKRRRKKDFEPQAEIISRNELDQINRPTPNELLHTGTVSSDTEKIGDSTSDESHTEYKKYRRLFRSSAYSSDSDSQLIDYEALRTRSTGVPGRNLSLSPSPVFSGPGSPPSFKNRALENPNSTSKATTFLPSLSMGGYFSGSEAADADEGSGGGQPRKNRRGQRERRLIAEKKFGQNAKHMKYQGRRQDRDRGWDPKRGAQAEETNIFTRMKRQKGKAGGTQIRQKPPQPTKRTPVTSSGANRDPILLKKVTIKANSAEGPLHPSWQAAKKAKEQKQAATFQGKKITFEIVPAGMAAELPSTYDDPVQIAIIGGTGLGSLPSPPFKPVASLPPPSTPWGLPSSPIAILSYTPPGASSLKPIAIAFLARHGLHHQLAPHEIPNQANIAALRKLGVRCVVAFSAVGSLKEEVKPRDFVVVDQLIDWTRGVRPWTFFEGGMVGHVGFADPFDASLSKIIAGAIGKPGVLEGQDAVVHPKGTVICIEGPQFSTRAESIFYRNGLNASVINMSAVPESKLAREAEMAYSMVCMSTDYDSWHETNEAVSVEMVVGHMTANAVNARRSVEAIIEELAKSENVVTVQAEHWKGMVKGAGGITKIEGRSPEALKKLAWLFPGYFEEGTWIGSG
ncbi:MAG: hypothetical protein Q9180_005198 [Flavoplaca navasiana]